MVVETAAVISQLTEEMQVNLTLDLYILLLEAQRVDYILDLAGDGLEFQIGVQY